MIRILPAHPFPKKETTTTINGLPAAVSMQDELNLTVQTVYTDNSLGAERAVC